ncbi:hypothetical protein T4E_6502 [Trichinella pseudospiralis]|uniref:Uncharacterized protein n=1 Tax=Trichinella pseudospiralis TaxID=6337 RepID=A0A0V0YGC6_TRIPS|nr:hypothetical protein T4E_6502 [Trichinella pseudospiralis]
MNLKSKRFMSFEVVFQFCQSAGHSFMHIAWFCLFGRKFSHLKIDAFPRLEASLNNELSEPPPPLPPYPVTPTYFTWPFLLPAFHGAIEA